MPWVKLDDQFFGHPKVLMAGGDAALLYLAGLCYCQAHLTDGVIPSVALGRLTDRKNTSRLAEKLVEVRLWERHEMGYMVHDYHDHNDESEKIKAKRAATKKRVAEWREKHTRNSVTSSVTEQDCNGVTNAPVTLPPSASASASSEKDTSAPPTSPPRFAPDFEAIYARYPKRKGDSGKKRGMDLCKSRIKTPEQYARLARAVERYATERAADVGTEFIPMFSTWISEGRWEDAADLAQGTLPVPSPTEPARRLPTVEEWARERDRKAGLA